MTLINTSEQVKQPNISKYVKGERVELFLFSWSGEYTKMIRIKEVDHCLGEFTENNILVHKDLYDYDKELYEYIIEHEKGHIGNTTWEDFVHDWNDTQNWRFHLKLLPFMFKHPELMLKNLLPIWYFPKEKKWEVCPTQIFQQLFLLIILFVVYYFVYS